MIKTAFKRAALAAGFEVRRVPAQLEPLKNLGWSRLWSRNLKIGDYYILLPPEHKLPEYQAKGRLYDRFLPTLCLALPQDGETIIDVGANVGDSAIAIVQRCDNPILAIEGDEFYLDYLHRNVTSLPARLKEHITVVPAMIGSGRIAGSLVRDGTTATRSKNAGPALSESLSLDDLLETRGVPKDSVSLIKVDTDGFDWDVLLSGQKTLHASRPLLYWENQIAPEYAEELKSFYEALGAIGYNHLSIFDNFGNLMLADCGFNELLDLTSYVCRQDHANCERAIYYTDVLAACEEHTGIVRSALDSYSLIMDECPRRKGNGSGR